MLLGVSYKLTASSNSGKVASYTTLVQKKNMRDIAAFVCHHKLHIYLIALLIVDYHMWLWILLANSVQLIVDWQENHQEHSYFSVSAAQSIAALFTSDSKNYQIFCKNKSLSYYNNSFNIWSYSFMFYINDCRVRQEQTNCYWQTWLMERLVNVVNGFSLKFPKLST